MVESKNQALLELATAVLRSEATAILDAADMLDESFCKAIELLQNCTGSVVVTGMGKAGLIGRKNISNTRIYWNSKPLSSSSGSNARRSWCSTE